MKTKILKFSLLTAILGIALWSCNKENNLPPNKGTQDYSIQANISLEEKFENTYNSLNILLNDPVEFDFSTMVQVGDADNNTFLVNQIGFDENNGSNYGLTIFLNENGQFINPMIIETKKANNNIYEINYYDVEFNLQMNIRLDNEQFDFYPSASPSWGQNTMDCITDAYTNHGWVSVWAWAQTAFIPQTAAALAIVCATRNTPLT